eukprot:COSAG04_NODE_413_length_14740_cov_85.508572_2_plen_94_part_00
MMNSIRDVLYLCDGVGGAQAGEAAGRRLQQEATPEQPALQPLLKRTNHPPLSTVRSDSDTLSSESIIPKHVIKTSISFCHQSRFVMDCPSEPD